ncbi:MAG: hypothetical protein WCW77_02115 [Patescibacteria group bacterium]|jgi:hypothetical protein
MLLAKKASLKKIAIYSAVIAIMVIGTGVMVYNNYIAGSSGQGEELVGPEIELLAASQENVNGEPAQTAQPEARTNPEMKKGSSSVEIIENQKFKSLKEIIPEESKSKIGNPFPFKPYE